MHFVEVKRKGFCPKVKLVILERERTRIKSNGIGSWRKLAEKELFVAWSKLAKIEWIYL